MPFERDPNEIGALWVKAGRKGEFLSGTINGVQVVCFRNDRKTGNAPDWRVLKSQPRDGATEPDRRRAPHNANAPSDDPFGFGD